MKIASASRGFIVVVALAGAVGVSSAHAGTAAIAGQSHPATATASTTGQRLAPPQVASTATPTAGGTMTRKDSSVSLAEASRIAALTGHGRVTESDQESTSTGQAYEVTVVRPDGTERKVTVARGTGRVLSNTVDDTYETREAADSSDVGDHPDSDQDGTDQQRSGYDSRSDG